jgi:transcriptional regulator with GAF, ATPase, and Fis domain
MFAAENHSSLSPSRVLLPRVLIVSSSAIFRSQWVGHPLYSAVDLQEAAGGADALSKLESDDWGEVLLDRKLHDLDVDELIRIIRLRYPQLLVRLVDAGPVLDAAEAGPSAVPIMNSEATRIVAAESSQSAYSDDLQESPVKEIDPHKKRIEPLPGMVDAGAGLEQIFRLARLVGPRQTTVLITGETGTGKELVARGIHQISSRARNPFVVVNCAAIPEQLLEAELFGHARGAFTGAVQSRLGRIHAAHGGTLFLDEVGELPLSMQAKLLRFLQDGEVQRLGSSDVFRVDVRVISATNVNLLRCIRENKFRQDLYYRLAVFPLELPSLRQRKEQIVALAQHFLNAFCEQAGVAPKQFSTSAAAALRHYCWPGNVRELQHAVERAFILAEEERELGVSHFLLPETGNLLREF